jgi:hypothetical protein
LECITGGEDSLVDSLPFFMPLKDMEAALRSLLINLTRLRFRPQDLFRLKSDASSQQYRMKYV